MIAIEYGKEHRETIILLHGGGLSWWSCRSAAEILEKRYHVVIPILDGHAGSDRDFSDIESAAGEILSYIDENCHGTVPLIGGLSLGGQILTEMLARKSDVCQCALIESALAEPMRLTHLLVKPMLDASFGLIRRKWFARLQFRSLRLKEDLFDEYFRDTCRITKANMTAFLKANSDYRAKNDLKNCRARAYIFDGQRESAQIIRSAHTLNRLLPESTLEILPGFHHGEFSICHAQEYAHRIIQMLDNRL